MSTLDSFDAMLESASTNGLFNRMVYDLTPATTAANATSGRINALRYPNPVILPAVGGGITGAYITTLSLGNSAATTVTLGALEYNLGALTISGNSFADGVAMPTKTVMGSSITTATTEPMLVVTTVLVATTPTITITYTDQDGNTGATATLTLPTSPVVNTAFRIAPHLAAGDTGIRDITNISTSGGTSGVLTVMGLLTVNCATTATAAISGPVSPVEQPSPMYLWEAGEKLAFYRYNSTVAARIYAHVSAVAET